MGLQREGLREGKPSLKIFDLRRDSLRRSGPQGPGEFLKGLQREGLREGKPSLKIFATCTALWRELYFDPQILKNNWFFVVFVLAP